MNPNETASVVASALGQSTNHPGTARLARDLADALTRPIDPAPHDPEPFDEMTGPMVDAGRMWCVTVKHDRGRVKLSTFARTGDDAARIVCNAEGAPLSAVVSVKPT